MIEGLIRIEDAVMALNEDVAWLESEGAIGIDIVEMRNRVLEWLYELPTVPQKEYTEQQIRDTFNSGFSCGMEREWIDTEEEMPIDSQEVIASVYWTDYGDTILAYGHYNARFDNWKLYSDSEGELIKGYEVVAWMPLPYPYTADRKTENSSEKPNNYCDDCLYTDTCDSKEFFYACTSKATISKMEQVDEPQTDNPCDNCQEWTCDWCAYALDGKERVMKWTVYSEEKPQMVGSYLVTHTPDSGRYYVDYDYWTVSDKFKYHPTDVVAWMPFPEPWKGADDDRND